MSTDKPVSSGTAPSVAEIAMEIAADPTSAAQVLCQQEDRLIAAEGEIERLRGAVRWALGEGDSDFGDHWTPDAAPFWWRTELKRRAGL